MGVGLCPIPYFLGGININLIRLGFLRFSQKGMGFLGFPWQVLMSCMGILAGLARALHQRAIEVEMSGAATWAGGHGLPWHAMDENGGINDVLLQGT